MNVNAAAAAAAVGALHLPPALPHSSFNSYYDDAGMDEYEGLYGNLMNEFNAVGGRAPNELRQLASANTPKIEFWGCIIALNSRRSDVVTIPKIATFCISTAGQEQANALCHISSLCGFRRIG